MRKVRTAVIGAGFMGRVHAEGIQRLGTVEIAAVAAITEQEARGLADKIGVERATGDWRIRDRRPFDRIGPHLHA